MPIPLILGAVAGLGLVLLLKSGKNKKNVDNEISSSNKSIEETAKNIKMKKAVKKTD